MPWAPAPTASDARRKRLGNRAVHRLRCSPEVRRIYVMLLGFLPFPSPAGAVVALLTRSGSLAEKEELVGVAAGLCRGSLPAAALAPHVASDVAFGRAKTTSWLVTRRVHARKVFDGMRGQCPTATRVPGPFPRSSATPNPRELDDDATVRRACCHTALTLSDDCLNSLTLSVDLWFKLTSARRGSCQLVTQR